MDSNPPRDNPDDPRTTFLRSLPRKVVEIKATFGALIADPRSSRMRDELRRKLHTLYTLARSYQLAKLTEALRSSVDVLDATRAFPALARPHIDTLAALIASFSACAESDTHITSTSSPPSASMPPGGTREDTSRVATVRVSASSGAPRPSKGTLPPDPSTVAEPTIHEGRASPTPFRTLPPGTMLRKGALLSTGQGAATQVLFVGTSARANELHEALPAEVELLVTRTAADGVSRAKDNAPDIVVAEVAGPADGIALAQALRAEPLTEYIPVVLVCASGESPEVVRHRCHEAVEAVAEHTSGAALWDLLDGVLRGEGGFAARQEFGDLTLDELTRIVQDEIRRGLVGAASPRARGARIALGSGSEVLSATWEAIAHVREVVERRSNGAVRFDVPTTPRGMPDTQVFMLGGEGAQARTLAAHPSDDPLPNRKVLVVDDDPAVVGTFAALLRDAGAIVSECRDGHEAFTVAQNIRPDLVIADIVMPGLDGFALCNAIRRDPGLRHTPVVLLSWRDDLLVRVRELGAQAQGFVRKEAGGDAVLARVRDAIRLRVRLLRRVAELAGSAEVRGRLERVGLFSLLEITAASLHDATVTVSDQSSVSELHVRGGNLVSAVRTSHDGGLQRGEAALRQVLGTSSARFAVSRAMGAVRENLGGSLADLLANAARTMIAVEDSLVGTGLLEVTRVEVDSDMALAYARTLAPRLGGLVTRVMEGQSPRDLILRDGVAPAELEPVLVELARQGAVLKVLGPRGEDLAALRATGTPSIAPANVEPIERLLGSLAPRSEEKPGRGVERALSRNALHAPEVGSEASLADAVWNSLRVVGDESALRARKSVPNLPSAPKVEQSAEPVHDEVLAPLPEIDSGLEPVRTPSRPIPANLIDATRPSEEPRAPLRAIDEDRVVTNKVPSAPPRAMAPEPASSKTEVTADVRLHAGVALTQSDTSITSEFSREALDELKHNSVKERTPTRLNTAPTADANTSRRPPAPPVAALQSRSGARPKVAVASTSSAVEEASTSSPATLPATRLTTPTRPKTPPPERSAAATTAPHTADESERSLRPALLLLGIGFAFATSYYGVRWLIARNAPPVQVVDVPNSPEPEVSEAPEAPVTSTPTEPSREATPDVARAAPIVTLPSVRAEVSVTYEPVSGWLQDAALPARSGVLAVRAPPGGEAITVQIDQRDAVAPPAMAILPEGLHAVRLRSGTNSRYQLATVRAGEAVVLVPPSGL